MGPPHLVNSLSIIQLDVQVLIYALQRPADLHFILELDGDFMFDERFEETVAPVLALALVARSEYAPEEEHLCC